MILKDFIAVARGEKKADLLLKNGQLVNVVSGEIYPANVAIYKGRIAGIGDYDANKVINLNGKYVCPGFIDVHLHIESTMLPPPEFARITVPHGTTTVVADPHEIANVLGVEGIKYMLEASKDLPQNIFFVLPSCVPTTPLETSGAKLEASDLKPLLKEQRIIGLAEVMNFLGVIERDEKLLAKIEMARKAKVLIQGHAPGLGGKDLAAYIGAGIRSDHECVKLEEAKEKLHLGMNIFIREGSSAKNLEDLLPLLSPLNSRFISLCTDDMHPSNLIQGHINSILKKAVSLGLDPITAVQLATINPARHCGFKELGAIAPGYIADIVVVDNLHDFNVDMVFKDGKLVAEKGKANFAIKLKKKAGVRETIKAKSPKVKDFIIEAKDSSIRVIDVIPDQIITSQTLEEPLIKDKCVVSDVDRDILKLAVIERHKASGRVGHGFVRGFGLRRGAIAQTIAHDSHNIICVGVNDEDMLSAVREVIKLKGGIVVVAGGLVLAELPLPVAGLLSDEPLEVVHEKLLSLKEAAKEIGCKLDNPFGLLSFLALPVIPKLKLTDRGLVDVEKFEIVDLFE